MLAVHLEGGRVELREVPKPERPKGYALLRLICAGICNTDLELQRGYYGFSGIPGHEFVATVVEAGNTRLIDQRVVGEINLNCRECEMCQAGLGRHCPNRTVLGIAGHPGCFAEYFTLPEHNLHLLPESLATEDAVFAEPLAAACEIFEQLVIPAGTTAAVLGDGKLGLLVALVLKANEADVRLYGRHRDKLAIAEQAGIPVEIAGTLPKAAYELVVEATGSAAGLRQAVEMARPRGTVVVKSTVHEEVALDMAPVIVNEISLVGSRCGRFQPALHLLREGAVRPSSLIRDRFPLCEAPRAFARAAEKGNLKVLLLNNTTGNDDKL